MKKTQKMRKWICATVLMACLAACVSKKAAVRPADTGAEAQEPPTILFLSGKMAYDSLTATYSMLIDRQERFEGKLNLEGAAETGHLQGLHYLQVDADSTVLSRHKMDNPLIQHLEYFDGPIPVSKTVTRTEAPLYMRVQLHAKARRLVFRYDTRHIMTLDIDKP